MSMSPASKWFRYLVPVVSVCGVLYAAAWPDDAVETVKSTLARLWDYQASNGADKGWSIAFSFPETVVNDYIKYLISSHTRDGVRDASVKLKHDSVELTCTVDVGRIHEWRPQLFKAGSPLLDKDTLTLKATFNVTVAGNTATVTVVSVSAGDAAVDATLARQVLDALAAGQPEHFDLSKAVHLPFTLKRVQIGSGLIEGET